MKISEIHTGQAQEISGKRGNAQEGGSFQKVLEDAAGQGPGKGQAVTGPESMPPPGGVQIVSGPEEIKGSYPYEKQQQLLRDIGETLDSVDFYAASLKNGTLSTSDMRPLVEHLEVRLEGLRALEQDPNLPGGLKNIVSDLAVTLGTEVAKFGRGDYDT